MNLILHKFNKFRKKEPIESLLGKLGLKREVWNMNKGESFWDCSQEDLKIILNEANTLYKTLIIAIQPRKLGDDESRAIILNSLIAEIRKRFFRKLNRISVAYQAKDVTTSFCECACGCGKMFKVNNKVFKKYASKKCRIKAKSKRLTENRKKLRGNKLTNCPFIECACGCGRVFKKPANSIKKYATKKCKLLFYSKKHYQEIKNNPEYKLRKKRNFQNFYSRHHQRIIPENYPLVKCVCGCGQTFRQIPVKQSAIGVKQYFSKSCQSKMYQRKLRVEQKKRHEQFLKIIVH